MVHGFLNTVLHSFDLPMSLISFINTLFSTYSLQISQAYSLHLLTHDFTSFFVTVLHLEWPYLQSPLSHHVSNSAWLGATPCTCHYPPFNCSVFIFAFRL